MNYLYFRYRVPPYALFFQDIVLTDVEYLKWKIRKFQALNVIGDLMFQEHP
jgi:hypothetical protein